MFALADCNNFYASCHRLFEPQFNGVPVVVLSNNDGCIIARSNEAKDCGISMGIQFEKIKEEISRHQVAVFSSHYTLYGDISARVMTNLSRFSPHIEVYSIDECFLQLADIKDLIGYARTIKTTVTKNTGIPISVGIAPTKVLAKVANKISKKYNGVMVLESDDQISRALADYPIKSLWGIGRESCKKLHEKGIMTASQFRSLPVAWVKANLTVVGERIWRELWGESCIPIKNAAETPKMLTTSRSFGVDVSDLDQLREVASSYASRLAAKLRRERVCTNVLSVRLFSRDLKPGVRQLFPAVSEALPLAANNTFDLIHASLVALEKSFKKGYQFYKLEVTAMDLVPEDELQLSLFSTLNSEKFNQASRVMDRLNAHFGHGTVKTAGEGMSQTWAMKREFLRPSYTTDWKDIIKVK